MREYIEIENIEEMRRREGIDDVELREAVRALGVGDRVKLTFRAGAAAGETLLVRITSVRAGEFRGKLADAPSSPGLSKLRVGSPVAFTAFHIHSIAREQPARAQSRRGRGEGVA
jgi:hypothetical protein